MARPGRGAALSAGPGHDHTTVGRPVLDGPGDYLLAGILVLVTVTTLGTWLIGQTAVLITGGGWLHLPVPGTFAVLTRLPRHLSDPALAWPVPVRGQLPGPMWFVVAASVDTVLVAGLLSVVARRWGRRRRRRGFASAAQVADTFSPAAVTRNLERLRPSAPAAPAGRSLSRHLPQLRGLLTRGGGSQGRGLQEASVDAGHTDPMVHGTSAPVRIGIENSVLVLAAPRQGKTSQVVIPWVTSWQGPALVTSVRPDVVRATAALRPGTARVMDLTGTTWAHPLTWSPSSGCASFDTARRRADLLVTVGKATGPAASDATNAAFFGTSATNLLAGWLHAAALTGRDMRTVLTWALDDSNEEPVTLLRRHPHAADGTAGMLNALYRSPNETKSNLFTTVLTGLAPLLSETAQATFCPTGPGFDADAFLDRGDTVYLIVPESHAHGLAPLVSSFVDDVIRAATTRAMTSPTARLDPPLGLFLDEVANVAPLPHLPQLMSYAAGSGIFTTTVLQDLAQARARWGRDGADMIWAAATCKVILGGLTGDEPDTISRLAGTYRETVTTTARTPTGATTSSSLHDRQILTPEAIRTLDPDQRQALVLHATTPPVITRMVRHYEGPLAKDHDRSVAQTQPHVSGLARRTAAPAAVSQP